MNKNTFNIQDTKNVDYQIILFILSEVMICGLKTVTFINVEYYNQFSYILPNTVISNDEK